MQYTLLISKSVFFIDDIGNDNGRYYMKTI